MIIITHSQKFWGEFSTSGLVQFALTIVHFDNFIGQLFLWAMFSQIFMSLWVRCGCAVARTPACHHPSPYVWFPLEVKSFCKEQLGLLGLTSLKWMPRNVHRSKSHWDMILATALTDSHVDYTHMELAIYKYGASNIQLKYRLEYLHFHSNKYDLTISELEDLIKVQLIWVKKKVKVKIIT